MRYLVAAVLLALLPVGIPQAEAQTSTVVGVYSPGWNMVGGPAGTLFTGSDAVYRYDGQSYVASSSPVADACVGYWAHFVDPATVALPAATGPSRTCTLLPGWNLVGNPFSGAAGLPSGVVGYHWNPDASRYDIVSAIPPGASVWIYSRGGGSVLLTYVPSAQPRVPVLLVNSYPANPGPYVLHVGDALKLLLPITTPYDITTDSRYLVTEDTGMTGPMTCSGTCVINFLNQFYTFRAVAAGNTVLTLSPQCLRSTPVCAQPVATIAVTILP
jgi:hypothetical protein